MLLTQPFSFDKSETLAELLTIALKTKSRSEQYIDLIESKRDQVVADLLKTLRVHLQNEPDHWCTPAVRGHLWCLLGVFHSLPGYSRVELSHELRPLLLQIHFIKMVPLLDRLQSGMQNDAQAWRVLLETLQVYWRLLLDFHSGVRRSGLIRRKSFILWGDVLPLIEKILFLGSNRSSNLLLSPFGDDTIDSLCVSVKSMALDLCLLVLRLYIKSSKKDCFPEGPNTAKFKNHLSNVCRMILNCFIQSSTAYHIKSPQESRNCKYLSVCLEMVCLSTPIIPSQSLPDMPVSLISHFLLPLARIEYETTPENPTDQLAHLSLLVFDVQKEPSLAGVSLFALRSLCSSVDSFCSRLLGYIFSSPVSAEVLLLLGSLAPLLVDRENLFPKCLEFLTRMSASVSQLNEIMLSCLLLCTCAFAEQNPQKLGPVLTSLLAVAFGSNGLCRLTGVSVLKRTFKICVSNELLKDVLPGLIRCLNNPPFEPEIPETVALILPLSVDWLRTSPVTLTSLLSVTIKITQSTLPSLNFHTINRLLTIIRFTTEDPFLYDLAEQTLLALIPGLFPLMPQSQTLSEEVLQIVCNCVRNSSVVPVQFLSILKVLPQVQQADNHELNGVLRVLNLFLYFSPSLFASTDIDVCLSMARKCIDLDQMAVFDSNFSRAHGYLLVQVIMDLLRDQLEHNHINWTKQLFFSHFSETFTDVQTPLTRERDIQPLKLDLYRESLFGIFLIGAYLFPKQYLDFAPTQDSLNFLWQLVTIICEHTHNFSPILGRKILILGLTSIFKFALGFLDEPTGSLLQPATRLLAHILSSIILVLKVFQSLDKFNHKKSLVKKRKKVFEEIEEWIVQCERFSQALNCECDLREDPDFDDNHMILNAMLDVDEQRKKLYLGIQSRLFGIDELGQLKQVVGVCVQSGRFGAIRGQMNQTALEFADEILKSTQLVNFDRAEHSGKYRKIRRLKWRSQQKSGLE